MGAAESKEQKKENNKSLKIESRNEAKKESKNEPKNNAINEVTIGSAKPIPVNIAYKVTKAVCKITIEKKWRKKLWNRIFFE